MESKSFIPELKVYSGLLIKNKFIKEVDNIKNKIAEDFKDKLLFIDTSKSSINFEKLFEEFKSRLDVFKYIIVEEDEIKLNIPDTDKFDFSGKLELLRLIAEGVVGDYYELPVDKYTELLSSKLSSTLKNTLQQLSTFKEGSVEDYGFIFVPANTKFIQIIQNVSQYKLSKFPFSNSEPIDVFYPGIKYVKDNIEDWISTAVSMAIKTQGDK